MYCTHSTLCASRGNSPIHRTPSPMAVETTSTARPSFDLKSAQLPVVAVTLRDTDVRALVADLAQRLADDPDFFDNDPVLIDLAHVREAEEAIDFAVLVEALRFHRTVPVAVRGGSPAQMEAARAAGLAPAPEAAPVRPTVPEIEIQEVVREIEVVREVPAPQADALIVDKPLRSGQRVYARGTDIVVLAMVSYGAEVIADGNVHVYAPLRGRAIAGARGNTEARIFSTCMEAQLLSIAGIYRTIETDLPADVAARPAKVRLDGEKILIEPV
ncbi:septum site-determining protein MinC [Delftia lacustris]|uniref:Probable septum site-determining protein MinC n=4 Tax=Delftia TaxID=80865 RepID=A0A1H3I2I0_9BURK|nr:septum site-determining protein MinC [Delftia acidovorans CCUG 15835]SDY21927.1 septum site-determining protein MinC [Delftia lacustris]SFB47022.1 septum site-determining protein MinC [Delftia tsuruhatensis]